jgi:hypothetical protein
MPTHINIPPVFGYCVFQNHSGRHSFQVARNVYRKPIENGYKQSNEKKKIRSIVQKPPSDVAPRLKNTCSEVLTPPLPYGCHNIHPLS